MLTFLDCHNAKIVIWKSFFFFIYRCKETKLKHSQHKCLLGEVVCVNWVTLSNITEQVKWASKMKKINKPIIDYTNNVLFRRWIGASTWQEGDQWLHLSSKCLGFFCWLVWTTRRSLISVALNLFDFLHSISTR